jgi:hypothetical protein
MSSGAASQAGDGVRAIAASVGLSPESIRRWTSGMTTPITEKTGAGRSRQAPPSAVPVLQARDRTLERSLSTGISTAAWIPTESTVAAIKLAQKRAPELTRSAGTAAQTNAATCRWQRYRGYATAPSQ